MPRYSGQVRRRWCPRVDELSGYESHALAMPDTFSLVTPQFIVIDPRVRPPCFSKEMYNVTNLPAITRTVRPHTHFPSLHSCSSLCTTTRLSEIIVFRMLWNHIYRLPCFQDCITSLLVYYPPFRQGVQSHEPTVGTERLRRARTNGSRRIRGRGQGREMLTTVCDVQ